MQETIKHFNVPFSLQLMYSAVVSNVRFNFQNTYLSPCTIVFLWNMAYDDNNYITWLVLPPDLHCTVCTYLII